MKRIWTLAIAGVALAMIASCTDVAKPLAVTNANETRAISETRQSDEGHDAPRILLADAKKAYDDGDAVIVDVRDVNAYNQEHVKGSVNITVQDIDAKIDKLPKGKKIIAYCS